LAGLTGLELLGLRKESQPTSELLKRISY